MDMGRGVVSAWMVLLGRNRRMLSNLNHSTKTDVVKKGDLDISACYSHKCVAGQRGDFR